jgi:ribonuclease HI
MSGQKPSIKIPAIKKQETKIYPVSDYILNFDGCSKGNPGPSGIGAVLYKNKVEIWVGCKYLGDNKTNNEAEYSALIFGLEQAIKLNIKTLSVCGDSLLVINQINGLFKVKHPNLLALYNEVINLSLKFTYIDFNHVYRNYNKRADQLSNQGLNDELNDSIKTIVELDEDWSEEIVVDNLLKKSFLPKIK